MTAQATWCRPNPSVQTSKKYWTCLVDVEQKNSLDEIHYIGDRNLCR